MSLTDTSLMPDEAVRLLRRWGMQITADRISPGSGTANASVVMDAPEGRLLLRRRNPRYAREDWVRFDHALLSHLAARDVPVPQAIRAENGAGWVVEEGAIYELFEFIEGQPHRPGDPAQLRAAGETLARIHLSAQGFRPPASKQWGRFHDPKEAAQWLDELLAIAEDPGQRQALALAVQQTQELARRLTDRAYRRLPQAIVQADYHPANLLFRGGEVAGVFDWDWASRQPRMVDLADGLLFFCGVRESPVIGADIWSLSEAFEIDPERVAFFGAGYTSLIAPEATELAVLPDLMRARWLYSRADAAMRKVEGARRVEFVTRGLHRPLAAISRLEADLIDGSALRTDPEGANGP